LWEHGDALLQVVEVSGMISITAFGSGGNLALTTQIRSAALADGSQASGLECGVELRCDLDVPADQVRVMISSVDDRVTVAGLDASNRIVAQQLVGQRLRIVEIVLVAPGVSLRVSSSRHGNP
jgi:hypothetical protein